MIVTTDPSHVRPLARALEPSGRRNAIARENQLLPGHWTQLGAIDLARIDREIESRAAKKTALATLEACLLLRAVLSTGQKLDVLAALPFRLVARGDSIRDSAPALLYRERAWSWWLPAGHPKRKRRPTLDPAMAPVSDNVWLPVSEGTHRLIQACLSKRAAIPNAAAQRLFISSLETLRARVQALLQSRPPGAPKTRRAATTVESAERWMLRALAQEAGGDIGAASLITARSFPLATPMTYYGALPMQAAVTAHNRVLRRLDRAQPTVLPGELAPLAIGDSIMPSDNAVHSLVGRLQEHMKAAGDLAQIHEAMTRYTCALVTFALALRGRGGEGKDEDMGVDLAHHVRACEAEPVIGIVHFSSSLCLPETVWLRPQSRLFAASVSSNRPTEPAHVDPSKC